MLLELGRPGALGAVRRIETWRAVIEATGRPAETVRLHADHRRRSFRGLGADAARVARGHIVPEALTWDATSVRLSLDRLRPELVVAITGRSFHPGIAAGPWTLILDFVDCMSDNYRQRGTSAGLARRLAYRALGWTSSRFEGQSHAARTVAAGWDEAKELRAEWMPNVTSLEPMSGAAPDHDLVFVGSLSYPPNVDALRHLALLWPEILGRRARTTLLVAGARPAPAVLRLAREHGWEVAADFTRPEDVYGRGRIAVAPLPYANGIQNKIIEAAALGVPQVVSRAAAAGLPPEFPGHVALTDADFVDATIGLLDVPSRASALAGAGVSYIDRYHRPGRWAEWLERWIP